MTNTSSKSISELKELAITNIVKGLNKGPLTKLNKLTKEDYVLICKSFSGFALFGMITDCRKKIKVEITIVTPDGKFTQKTKPEYSKDERLGKFLKDIEACKRTASFVPSRKSNVRYKQDTI